MSKTIKKRYSNKNIKLLYKVWNEIRQKLPDKYSNFILSVSADEYEDYALHKGAIAEPDHIIIGMEYVNKFPIKESLAFMLGHELGHQVLGHCGVDYNETKYEEWDCDQFGLFICSLIDCDMRKVLESSGKFEKWRSKSIDHSHRKSHGTAKERQERLKKQLTYLEIITDQDK